ncbi:contractile injection system tape measure protein [Chryseobacterium cucumeris]|uniref:contractile injection system tape measure protein n=1 Tax=Chryseobacterium cucumeris TaxID=1813611 RepID=UPI002454BD98|nr:contractile injection system tape measure protein [Chryseobacterium cucumeris]MDH5032600.1 contractile injection system tape measure protein [Chryseobacterium cucumeris]
MKQNHIIQKVFLEITVNNKEKALRIKDDINSFLSIDVFPEIEKHIKALEDKLAGHTLQIPRLELNVEVTSSALNTELKGQIAELFKDELSEITKPVETPHQVTESDAKSYVIDHQEKMLKALIYFLEKGTMPWWSSESNAMSVLEPAVFDRLISVAGFQKSIISALSKENVRNRLINQFSNEQIAQLCLAVLKNKKLTINLEPGTIRRLSKLSHVDRNAIWNLVFSVISEYLNTSDNQPREYLLQAISTIEQIGLSTTNNHQNRKTIVKIFPFITENEISENIRTNAAGQPENAGTSIETIQEKNAIIQEDVNQNEGQYIQNAGLILIHPFIRPLFEHCELLDAKTQQLIDPELCAHLLHYIATGKTNAPEYDMIFEKFLCNIPIHQTINRHIKLSRKHKSQAKKVIESVQYNWAPMKKSSVALLQNEFFQRTGKLVITDSDDTLIVERKTQDILLEKLSWGIGLVKLPWQKKFIFVNW